VIDTNTTVPDRQLTPKLLGKYPILGLVGEGAMGVVYKSLDPVIRRPVALKTIRRNLLDGGGAVDYAARFRNEAQAAGRLLHPGIVAVYEYGEEDQCAFIAMEYVEGCTLRRYLNQQFPFTVEDVLSVMTQLLDALQYAHEAGVWHRDIKPTNIIIMKSGQIKVADFGIARVETSGPTQFGATMGTPGYVAPEMYSSHKFDCRVDVFSAGVVLYELLAGVAPFGGPPETVMYRVCHETPAAPSVVKHDPSLERFDPIVLRALAKRARERYDSAAQFREALMQAQAQCVKPVSSKNALGGELPVSRERRKSHLALPESAPASTAKVCAAPSASTATLVAAGWDIAELDRIEQQLTRFIGPIAKVVVRRAAKETSDLRTLVHRLADQLSGPAQRSEFLKRTASLIASGRTSAGVPTGSRPALRQAPGAPGTTVPAAPTPEEVARATQLLTVHLGPIAQVLSKRAVQAGIARDRFFFTLAENLLDETDRMVFLGRFNETGPQADRRLLARNAATALPV
jgi:serine/threonine-protein kinase